MEGSRERAVKSTADHLSGCGYTGQPDRCHTEFTGLLEGSRGALGQDTTCLKGKGVAEEERVGKIKMCYCVCE